MVNLIVHQWLEYNQEWLMINGQLMDHSNNGYNVRKTIVQHPLFFIKLIVNNMYKQSKYGWFIIASLT